eukprot:TRINITY_DN885_c0_g1::TRINITY_DN885_c0_g1_i1::g.25312::m.25312 TRINITY_DN885_c0_g1::TRINITY_DN885_c0_g1_i1::g.25312  ORF type:complete len:141 (+),score=-3.22,DUF4608/PF15381.1/0.41,DUF4608/PF15381.1/4e+02 TRINITY_DN885_c0_g1_i1:219-641(+)
MRSGEIARISNCLIMLDNSEDFEKAEDTDSTDDSREEESESASRSSRNCWRMRDGEIWPDVAWYDAEKASSWLGTRHYDCVAAKTQLTSTQGDTNFTTCMKRRAGEIKHGSNKSQWRQAESGGRTKVHQQRGSIWADFYD